MGVTATAALSRLHKLRFHDFRAAMRRTVCRAAQLEQQAMNGRAFAGCCPVCGRVAVRFVGFDANLRESGRCSACGASNRQRQMGLMVRRSLGLRCHGPIRPPSRCSIYSAEANGPVHATLLPHPGYVGSEYFGEQYPSGAVVNGVRHEDLQQLSFPDSSLDIVLTSDVLEHVPDAYRAHAEIYRVLRPGGRHIFTVPFREEWQDDVRAILRDGEQHLLTPPLYHGDPVRPDQGVLVWRIFGYEMLARLDHLGFRAGMHRLYQPRYGIIGSGAVVFVARRPVA